jgi:4-amino-4-deoxychorismate lyase
MGPDDYKPASGTGRKVTSIKPSFNIIVDPLPTEVTPHTMLKTTYRPHYDASRARAFHSAITNSGLENKEVLLHNPAGEMMEGSVTTPYFYRNGRWVTPPVGSEHGGQRGTTRRWALATGMAVEEIVPRESVKAGERLWLSNGVRGFAWGVVAELR